MTNKISQKKHYNSFEGYDAFTKAVVNGKENEYRRRFVSRRAEKMAKIAGFDDGSTVLEVGCGTGIYTIYWVKSCKKFFGLDISEGMLKRAKTKIDSDSNSVLFVEGDAENLPFRGACFDVVLSVNTIEHMDDIPLALKEMKRVCKEGGRIALSMPNDNFSSKYREKLIQTLKRLIKLTFKGQSISQTSKAYNDDFTHRHLTMEDVNQLLNEIGIVVEFKLFMGFVPHQIIPVRIARYFVFMETLERILEKIPWIKEWGGTITICGKSVGGTDGDN